MTEVVSVVQAICTDHALTNVCIGSVTSCEYLAGCYNYIYSELSYSMPQLHAMNHVVFYGPYMCD